MKYMKYYEDMMGKEVITMNHRFSGLKMCPIFRQTRRRKTVECFYRSGPENLDWTLLSMIDILAKSIILLIICGLHALETLRIK
jgi:hypothetical protein